MEETNTLTAENEEMLDFSDEESVEAESQPQEAAEEEAEDFVFNAQGEGDEEGAEAVEVDAGAERHAEGAC